MKLISLTIKEELVDLEIQVGDKVVKLDGLDVNELVALQQCFDKAYYILKESEGI